MTQEQKTAFASKRIIVSMTSYPARIHSAAKALETVYAQTRPADQVILWLAKDQFPNAEEDLPMELLGMIQEGKLTVRWCDDLKPHKKYFYALQEFRQDLVVTVDDDLLYPAHMLENLYQSYLRHPNAVSTLRAHLMAITPEGKILPYSTWVKETDLCLDKPSMQLFSTGGAGCLYPAELFDPKLFREDVIRETCLRADDLWLKAVQLLCDVPVVVAQPFEELRYVPGTQEEGLYHGNEDGSQNDVQLENICRWADETFEAGILGKKLTQGGIGEELLGVEVFSRHAGAERSRQRLKLRAVNGRLKETFGEKSELNAKLKQAYSEKSELNAKLQQAYSEKSELNAKLQQAYTEKSELNAKLQRTYGEKSELSAKLKQAYADKTARGNEIRQLKEQLERRTVKGFIQYAFQTLKKKLGR